MADMYVVKMNDATQQSVLKQMTAETYFTVEEAVANGLIDEVLVNVADEDKGEGDDADADGDESDDAKDDTQMSAKNNVANNVPSGDTIEVNEQELQRVQLDLDLLQLSMGD